MKTHLPQLDGLRGLAVLIVLFGHVAVFGIGFGIKALGPLPPLGVDLFFVLSGFLITNILIDARNGTHYYLNFYARRALRIWPLYAVMLVLFFAVLNHRVDRLTFDEHKLRWPFFALFLQNIVYHQATLLGPAALGLTWSLAVEEQFYLIWPVLVRKFSLKHLATVLMLIVAMAPVARFVAVRIGIDPYINPLCRFDGMAIGGLAVLWLRARKPVEAEIRRVVWRLLALSVAAEMIFWKAGLERYYSKTFVSLGFCALLLAALSSPVVIRLLSQAWLRHIGKVSYGIYLLHLLVGVSLVSAFPGISWGMRTVRAVCMIVGSLALATLSFEFLETPALRLKRFFPVNKPGHTEDSSTKHGAMREEPRLDMPPTEWVKQPTLLGRWASGGAQDEER